MKRISEGEAQQLLMDVTRGRSILFDLHSVRQLSDDKVIARTFDGGTIGIVNTACECMLFDVNELSDAFRFGMDVDSIYDVEELP